MRPSLAALRANWFLESGVLRLACFERKGYYLATTAPLTARSGFSRMSKPRRSRLSQPLPSPTHFHHRNRSFLSLSTGLTCHRTTLHNTALLVRCQSRKPLVPNQRIALLLCRTLRILDAGIHVACAVWRKFYDGTGTVDWLLLPDCLSSSLLFFWESFAFQVVASCFEPCIIRVDPVTWNAILGWI